MNARNGTATMAHNRIGTAAPPPVKGLRAGVEKITPEMAALYLEQADDAGSNFRKRSGSGRRIEILANMIREGRWQCNGVPIIFDQNDRLIDGQHRLAACVAAGVPITTMVVWGSTSDEFIDSNIVPRTMGQRAANLGLKNSSLIASIATLHYAYSHGARTQGECAYRRSMLLADEFRREVEANGAAYEAAASAAEKVRKRAHVTTTGMILLACFTAGRPAASASAYAFCAGVSDGVGLKPGDPRLYIRERSLAFAVSGAIRDRLESFDHSVLTAKAWNAFVRGEQMTRAFARKRETGIATLPEIVIP